MLIYPSISSMSRITDYQTRSISPENPTGENGAGGKATTGLFEKEASNLGPGWKYSPAIRINAGETVTIADIKDMGEIRHIWMTGYNINWRLGILRFYWDDSTIPSIECPLGDFFGSAEVNSLPPYNSLISSVNPKNALNCYWQMPFKKNCRVTFENLSQKECTLFYQITYILCPVPENCGYLHAQFRRCQSIPYKEMYTVADIKGKGQYAGTYMYFKPHGNDWWGEGEFKFYLDDDNDYPTICGTGTEDYFGGGDGFLSNDNKNYVNYSTPYCGFSVAKNNGDLFCLPRFSMYRWHIIDPIYFNASLKLMVQDLGWKSTDRSLGYEARRDDISSVAFWYQNVPSQTIHSLPSIEDLMII